MTIVRLALRGIRASLGRLILTTIAIVAGVGFVAGAFILADSLEGTFTDLFEEATSQIDAEIKVAELEFGQDTRTISDTLVDKVTALPQVGKASPSVRVDPEENFRPFTILDAEGNKIEPRGGPIISFSWDGSTDGGFLTLLDGAPPTTIDQVAIDSTYANAAGLAVGDQVPMVTPSGERTFELTAIVEPAVSAGAYYVFFDFTSAQTLFGKEGQVDSIDLQRADGVSTAEMITAVQTVLPPEATVLDRTAVIEDQSAGFDQIISIFRNLLLAFAGIALFVSLFIIYNTFAILVNQRLQQIGMLRAIGATRGQIRIGVVLEALIVGVSAANGARVGNMRPSVYLSFDHHLTQ